MKNVIKTVERIKDRYGKNELVFKDEEGRIAYLDKYEDKDLVREMVPAVGGKIKCYVVKSLTNNDFIRTSINGTGLDTHINNIPNLSYSSLNRLGKEFVWFLNTIYNTELKGTTTFSIIKDNPISMEFINSFPDTWESVVIDGLTFTNYINIMSYIHYNYSDVNSTKVEPKISNSRRPVYSRPTIQSKASDPYTSVYNRQFNQAGFQPQQQYINLAQVHQQRPQSAITPDMHNMTLLDKFDTILVRLPLNTKYNCSFNGSFAQLIVKKVYNDKDPVIVIIRNMVEIEIITKDINLNELYALDLNQPLIPIF